MIRKIDKTSQIEPKKLLDLSISHDFGNDHCHSDFFPSSPFPVL